MRHVRATIVFGLLLFSLGACKSRESELKDNEYRVGGADGIVFVVYRDNGKVFYKRCDIDFEKTLPEFFTRNQCQGVIQGIENPFESAAFESALREVTGAESTVSLDNKINRSRTDLDNIKKRALEGVTSGNENDALKSEIGRLEGELSGLQAKRETIGAKNTAFDNVISHLDTTEKNRLSYRPEPDYQLIVDVAKKLGADTSVLTAGAPAGTGSINVSQTLSVSEFNKLPTVVPFDVSSSVLSRQLFLNVFAKIGNKPLFLFGGSRNYSIHQSLTSSKYDVLSAKDCVFSDTKNAILIITPRELNSGACLDLLSSRLSNNEKILVLLDNNTISLNTLIEQDFPFVPEFNISKSKCKIGDRGFTEFGSTIKVLSSAAIENMAPCMDGSAFLARVRNNPNFFYMAAPQFFSSFIDQINDDDWRLLLGVYRDLFDIIASQF